MGCNTSKGPQQVQGRGPKLQPPAGRPAAPVQSLTRVKLVLLGATGVGKSCLVLRYVKGLFECASRVTVGAAFMAHSVSLPDGRTVKFEIWDTAGQERYASLAPLYYRGAGAAVVMYDITSAETFTKAKYWVTELQKNAPGDLVIVLAGNKSDLVEARQVNREEGEAYAASNSMIFLETSAKTAANVAAVFEMIARRMAGGGAPPSGPAVPAAPPGPPNTTTHSASQFQARGSTQQGQPSKQLLEPPAAAPAAAAATGDQQQQQQQQQATEAQQAPTDLLASNQSTTSAASDGAGEPLPPSSDAAVLEGHSLTSPPTPPAPASPLDQPHPLPTAAESQPAEGRLKQAHPGPGGALAPSGQDASQSHRNTGGAASSAANVPAELDGHPTASAASKAAAQSEPQEAAAGADGDRAAAAATVSTVSIGGTDDDATAGGTTADDGASPAARERELVGEGASKGTALEPGSDDPADKSRQDAAAKHAQVDSSKTSASAD